MTTSTATLREGDVVTYEPPEKTGFLAGTDRRHCVEGMGVVRRSLNGQLHVQDTYWATSGEGAIYEIERLDEITVLFNLDDFERLARHETYKWERFAPGDRALLTSQHGLQRSLLVRKGATEDRSTIIQNARDELTKAEQELDSARFRVESRQRVLDHLLAEDPS